MKAEQSKKPVAVERILEAAQVEFASQGFEAVSVQQIAETAGVSAKLVYHYFGRKESLYVETLIRMAKDFFCNFERPSTAGHEPIEVVREFGLRFADFYLQNPHTGRLILDQVVRGGKEISRNSKLEALRATLLKPIEESLTTGRQQGIVRADVSAEGLFFHLVVLTLGYGTVLSLLEPWHLRVSELDGARPLREVIAEALVAFVRKPPAEAFPQPSLRPEERTGG